MSFHRIVESVSIPVEISARYFTAFLKLKCAPDLLRFFKGSDAKEITESFAAYRAAVTVLGRARLKDGSVVCLVPGDGKRPRTGAVVAFRSAWQVHSVDPIQIWMPGVERLFQHPTRVEHLDPIDCQGSAGVVLAVHSHANLSAAVSKLTNWSSLVVIAIPCCVPQELVIGGVHHHTVNEKRDPGIFSEKNMVKTWHIMRAK